MSYMEKAQSTYVITRLIKAIDPVSLILAIVIAFCSSYAENALANAKLTTQSIDMPMTIIWFAIAYIAIRACFFAWDTKSAKNHADDFEYKFWTKAFTYASVIFIVWMLIWIIPHFPGTVRDDTLVQLFQHEGIIGWTTQHPPIDTMIFGLFWEAFGIRNGTFAFITANSALLALSIGTSCSYCQRLGAPKWAVIIICIFAAFGRSFYQPADAMSKDSLNAWAFVFSSLIFIEAVRTNGKSLSNKLILVVALLLAFFCITSKRAMLAVIPVSYLILSIVIAVKSRKENDLSRKHVIYTILMTVLPIVLSMFVWTPLSSAALNVSQTKSHEFYSIPAQQVFHYLKENRDGIDENTMTQIERAFDIDEALSEYNPTRSDEVFRHSKINGIPFKFLLTWMKLGIAHPDDYLESIALLAGRWTSLLATLDYGHDSNKELLNEDRMEQWTSEIFNGDRSAADKFFEDIDFSHPEELSAWTTLTEDMDTFKKTILQILSSYGLFCFVIPLTALLWVISRKRWKGLLAFIPELAVLFMLFIGPMVLYWYTAPIVFAAPLMLLLPFGICNNKRKAALENQPKTALHIGC